MPIHTAYHAYELLQDVIGKGAGGVVSSAQDENGITVAVKVIPLKKNELPCSLFETEIKINQIVHRREDANHVIKFIDHTTDNHYGYIFMPHMHQDFFAYCKRKSKRGGLDEFNGKKLFYKMCLGVKALHDAGIAHLDLKPENVLLDKSSNPHICDFGRSYILEDKKAEITESPLIIQNIGRRGTPAYYPPELKKKETSYDPFAVDVFSLAVIFFVGVTNHFPYSSKREHHLRNDHIFMLNPKFVNLIEQMTTENPADRLSIDAVLRHRYFKSCRNDASWTDAFTSKLSKIGSLF